MRGCLTGSVELPYCVVQAPGEVDAWRFCVRVGTGQRLFGEWQGSEQQARVEALEFAERHGRQLVEVQGINLRLN